MRRQNTYQLRPPHRRTVERTAGSCGCPAAKRSLTRAFVQPACTQTLGNRIYRLWQCQDGIVELVFRNEGVLDESSDFVDLVEVNDG